MVTSSEVGVSVVDLIVYNNIKKIMCVCIRIMCVCIRIYTSWLFMTDPFLVWICKWFTFAYILDMD